MSERITNDKNKNNSNMKKVNILALALCLISFLACDKQGYVITGTAEGTVDGDTVYLCDMQGFFSMIPTDTAYVKDGQFEFKGDFDGAAIRYVIAMHNGDAIGGWADVILEKKANIKVQIFSDDSKKPVVESDGVEAQLYKEFMTLEDNWNKAQQPSWDIVREQKGTPEQIAAAQKTMDSITVEMHKAEKQFMIDHLPSGVSDMILSSVYSRTESDKEKAELLDLFKKKCPNTPNYKSIVADIEAKQRGKVGSTYTDFTMSDPDGKQLSISQFVKNNKYTLVDFWASWCGPCCAEMPNVVKAYEKFHSKGLEIIGVSLDNDKAAWQAGLNRLKMSWPQMSDLKGWECEAASLYGIQAIPSNILIDQSGKIVAKDLREEELQTKLAELLDKD